MEIVLYTDIKLNQFDNTQNYILIIKENPTYY